MWLHYVVQQELGLRWLFCPKAHRLRIFFGDCRRSFPGDDAYLDTAGELQESVAWEAGKGCSRLLTSVTHPPMDYLFL